MTHLLAEAHEYLDALPLDTFFAPQGDRWFRAAIMRAWDTAVGAVDAASERWSESSLDRTGLPHPLLGLLTVREMLAFTAYHTSHHLALIASRDVRSA